MIIGICVSASAIVPEREDKRLAGSTYAVAGRTRRPRLPLEIPLSAAMSERRAQAMAASAHAAVYATAGQWPGHYPGAESSGSVYGAAASYPPSSSSSYVINSSGSPLSRGQQAPGSYQTVMGQTGGYQSPDRQTSPYNPVQHERPSQHAVGGGLSLPPYSTSTLDHHTRLPPHSPTPLHALPLQPHLQPPPPPHQPLHQSPHAYSVPRSVQPLPYAPPPPQHTLHHHHQPASPQHTPQYSPPQISYAAQMDAASQYPASPQRPFSCDMCALSFNRQHDLKRHRDTHTGEKPFLCNGGCGKTFTRKDALKRHQVRAPPTTHSGRPAQPQPSS